MSDDLLYGVFTMGFVVGAAGLMFLLHPRVRNELGARSLKWRLLFAAAILFFVIGILGAALVVLYESQQETAGFSLAF